jgi:hypothetical protein
MAREAFSLEKPCHHVLRQRVSNASGLRKSGQSLTTDLSVWDCGLSGAAFDYDSDADRAFGTFPTPLVLK